MRRFIRSALVAVASTLVGVTPVVSAAAQPGADTTRVESAGVAGARQACAGPAIVCPARILFGLSVPRVLTLPAGLTSLETRLGHRADVVGTYQDFTEPMYTTRLRRAIDSGRTPMVTWEPFNARTGTTASYPLSRIAAGAYDAYLRRSADQAKAVRKRFIVRFGHEMNGFWYPWGQPRPLHPQSVAQRVNTPATYVAAYRHVVEVFRARGATNVAWMWSPNVTDANPNVTLRSLYPGDGYVDTIGLSGYLQEPTDTFESRYRATLTELSTIGVGKPVFVAETGAVVSESRPPQLTAMLDAMSAEPRITGLVYFSQPDKTTDYRIDTDAQAASTIRQALGRPRFALSTSDSAAFATTPLLSGFPRVGTTVSASFLWRGSPTHTSAGWLSCPTASAPSAQCTRVGSGTDLSVGAGVRGRYLRASLGVVSSATVDSATRTMGPVLNVPPAVSAAGVDLLAGSVRVRLPPAPAQVTNWVVRLDDGPRTYLPAGATEHYFNGLAADTDHTVTLAACDCPSNGPDTTVSFTLLARPAVPTYVAARGAYTVTLPSPARGQTAWVAIVDGVEEELPLATGTVTRSALASGRHSFGIRAVSGPARTGASFVYPQLL